ncbi:MAG: response regulator [Caldilineaceae bacterium]|nr:response regulator [Caldilineaceae bacterium]
MQVGNPGPSHLNDLRQRVKKVMRRLSPDTAATSDKLSPSASQQLLHKVRLYQNELEVQNEELRRTRSELESARARYFDLLEYTSILYNQAPVGYLTLTHEGIIVEANRTATTLLGILRDRLLEQSILQLIVAEDQPIFHGYRKQLLATQSPQRCELRMRRADGTAFYVQMDAAITPSILNASDATGNLESKRYIRTTISDISERVALEDEERKVRSQLETTLVDLRQTQAQMVKQERLAVVGQLAAGIAHDFNNILAAITLYAQLVSRAADLPANLQARMGVIVDQTSRATHLIQQILDFSRRTAITRNATTLTHFLQQFVELLQHTLPENILITLETEKSLQTGIDDVVDIDPSRIQQVLLNLAFNARDAMPNGGELRILLSHILADSNSPALASGTLAPGPWLRIAVSDTGTGISPRDLPHLFEPFFTTKGVGAGSGLGLAQVWGIIKQHEGEIDITSEVGKGTTFSLYLSALSVAPPAPVAAETEGVPHGHGECILVVEDNSVLSAALVSTLQQLEYQVLEARNGEHATRLMAQEGHKVSLILSDLLMPLMSGEALIQSLRAHGWSQPVVVLSGRPLQESELEQLLSGGQISWLPKPPTLEQLALALHEALHPQSA